MLTQHQATVIVCKTGLLHVFGRRAVCQRISLEDANAVENDAMIRYQGCEQPSVVTAEWMLTCLGSEDDSIVLEQSALSHDDGRKNRGVLQCFVTECGI